MTRNLAERLGAIALEDAADGAHQPLEELWAEGPAIVLFLRHFG